MVWGRELSRVLFRSESGGGWCRGPGRIAAASRKANDDLYRPGRIGLRICDPRYGRDRGSTRCQIQELSPLNFHRSPPVTTKLHHAHDRAKGPAVTGFGPSLHMLQNSNLSAIVHPNPCDTWLRKPPPLLGMTKPRRLPSRAT